MRYLVGLVSVLAGLGTLPQSVSAQAGEEGTPTEPSAQEPAPSSEPAPEEPVLRLELDDDSVQLAPGSLWANEELEEMELRVKRARIGLFSTMGATLLGGVFIGIGAANLDFDTGEGGVLLWTGFALASGGIVGMMTTGGMLARRKRKLRELQEAHYGGPRRVQWDLARSRLMF